MAAKVGTPSSIGRPPPAPNCEKPARCWAHSGLPWQGGSLVADGVAQPISSLWLLGNDMVLQKAGCWKQPAPPQFLTRELQKAVASASGFLYVIVDGLTGIPATALRPMTLPPPLPP